MTSYRHCLIPADNMLALNNDCIAYLAYHLPPATRVSFYLTCKQTVASKKSNPHYFHFDKRSEFIREILNGPTDFFNFFLSIGTEIVKEDHVHLMGKNVGITEWFVNNLLIDEQQLLLSLCKRLITDYSDKELDICLYLALSDKNNEYKILVYEKWGYCEANELEVLEYGSEHLTQLASLSAIDTLIKICSQWPGLILAMTDGGINRMIVSSFRKRKNPRRLLFCSKLIELSNSDSAKGTISRLSAHVCDIEAARYFKERGLLIDEVFNVNFRNCDVIANMHTYRNIKRIYGHLFIQLAKIPGSEIEIPSDIFTNSTSVWRDITSYPIAEQLCKLGVLPDKSGYMLSRCNERVKKKLITLGFE